MKRIATLLAAVAFLAAPATAQEVTTDDFEVATAGSLARLCSAPEGHAMNQYAVGFCYGWIAGIEQFYDELVADPRFDIKPTICPDGEISREEARNDFLEWMKSNPGMSERKALEGMILALRAKYPCSP